jgi:hypothetical protein
MLGTTFSVTADEFKEIFNARLAPYLPANLQNVEPNPSGWGNRYTFKPYTGAEAEPEEPYDRWKNDPKLRWRHEDERDGRQVGTEEEYELREKARYFLEQVYAEARTEWRNAKHLAALKKVLVDGKAATAWKRWGQAKTATDAAYAYLRDPEAAKEWATAVSRLIDTHTELKAAAAAFDEKAQEIAQIHWDHMHEEGYGHDEALRLAGHPEATDWEIHGHDDYTADYRGEWRDWDRCLQAQTARLIAEQEAHVAKIGRLTGQPTA